MVKPIHGKHSEYFEAILQLRDVADEVIDFVDDEIDRKNIPVAKIKKVTNGYDYYLGDGNLAKNLGKSLQEKFGVEFTVTASLFSWKGGKGIYRITVLFRGISFKKGDQVDYQGEAYTILVLGKKIMLQHTKTGKKEHLRYQDMKKIKARK